MKRLMILIIAIALIVPSEKGVEVNVVNATNKYIKITVNNKRKNSVYISKRFVLKKKVKGKWKKIHFKKGVKFAKTVTILQNEKKTIKIKWKKYFGRNLKKGKYKIIFIKANRFSLQ